jgi:hypothetical protein
VKNFNKALPVSEDLLNFNFTQIFTEHGETYFVSVVDKYFGHYTFNMKRKDSGWEIIDKFLVPAWIRKLQDELSDAIVISEL